MIWRYRLTLLFFAFLFFLVISKLFYWQVVKAEELSDLGQSQYGRYIKLIPNRGEIQTSDGFSIVANKTSYLNHIRQHSMLSSAEPFNAFNH